MKHIRMMEDNKQTKVMLRLGSFLKKFSFGANEQLGCFKTVGRMGNFAERIFFVRWWESDEE